MQYEPKRKPQEDYMKYFKLARHYIQAKYKISLEELEILLYLNSEDYFGRREYAWYANLHSFAQQRMDPLLDKGMIEVFRRKHGSQREIYCLSSLARSVCRAFYKTISGDHLYPENELSNPLFKKNIDKNDIKFKKAMLDLNTATKQLRHPSHVSRRWHVRSKTS